MIAKSLLQRAVVALAAWALIGCAGFQSPQSFSIQIVNVRLVTATVLETTAIFTLRLQNENPEAVTLNGGVHKFYIDGVFVGDGVSSDTLTVPRLSSETQEVTVHLRNLSMARRIKPLLEEKRFSYRVKSVLYVQRGRGQSRARISQEGQLDLREFQPTPPPAS